MARRQHREVTVVATADDSRRSDVAATTFAQHIPVTRGDALVRECQMAETITHVHIDTRVVEHQIRCKAVEQPGQHALQFSEIRRIVEAPR